MKKVWALSFLSISIFVGLSIFMFFNVLTFWNIIGFFLFLSYIFILLINFKAGLIFYIIVRSYLDSSSKLGINFGVGPENLASYITVVFIIVTVFYLLSKKMNIFRVKSFRLFCIFIAFCLISTFHSIKPFLSFVDLLRFVGLLMVALAAYHVFDRHDVKLLFCIFIGALILPILFSIGQLILRSGITDSGFTRIYGTFIHPNSFAFFLLTIMFFLFVNLIYNRFGVSFFLNILLLLVCSIFLVLTFTRAAWIGLFIGIFVSAILVREYRTRIIVFLLAFTLLISPLIVKRFADIGQGKTFGFRTDSWTWRIQTWTNSLPLFYEHPIVGIGVGMFPEVKAVYAHNDYVRLLVETGLVGCLIYIAFFFYLLIKSFLLFRVTDDLFEKQFALTIFILCIVYLLISFSDNLSRSASILTYFFVLVAFAEKTHIAKDRFLSN